MSRIFIKCMQGIGDQVYSRPFIKRLVDEGQHEIYMDTVIPDLFLDLNVKFIDPGRSNYRTQQKAFTASKAAFEVNPPRLFDRRIDYFYTQRMIRAYNIPTAMETAFGFKPGSTDLGALNDLPPLPVHGLDLPIDQKIAIIRPVTHRKEWLCAARSPRPNYVAWCARILKDAGWYVISIADVDGVNEWIEDEEPPANLQLHAGELGLLGTLDLMRSADLVVGGSGFIVPVAIATHTPLFIVFGGRGEYDNPHKLMDGRMDLSRVGWALPDNFCRCNKMEHDCDKNIKHLDDHFMRYLISLQQKAPASRGARPPSFALTVNGHPNEAYLPKRLRDYETLALNVKLHGQLLATRLTEQRLLLPPPKVFIAHPAPLTSSMCVQADIESTWCKFWSSQLGLSPSYHRKLWELTYVAEALSQRDMLQAGSRGVVFGCGEEPLPLLFAKQGCTILATDLAEDDPAAQGWKETAQHAACAAKLHDFPAISTQLGVKERVTFRPVNMNEIPKDLTGFDFCWSTCALEHLGSIEKGLTFIERSLDTLRPGGVAVHTMEFNLAEDGPTIDNWGTVLFQRKHLEGLVAKLEAQGHHVAPLSFDSGSGELDWIVDVPPWPHTSRLSQLRTQPLHLKLSVDGFPCTSFALIITKR